MNEVYEAAELRALATVLQHVGCKVAEDEYSRPMWDLRRAYARGYRLPLLLEVPKDRAVYVLYAKPGISPQNARQALVSQGHTVPAQAFATLWEFNITVYATGKDPDEPARGLELVADEPRARLWRLTGKLVVRESLGCRPGDYREPEEPREHAKHVYTGPRYVPTEARRINFYRQELAQGLLALGAGVQVYARREPNDPDGGGRRVGPLTHSVCSVEWSQEKPRVADLVVAVPEGKVLAAQVWEPGCNRPTEADAVLGKPAKELRSIRTALWLLDGEPGELPPGELPPGELPPGVVAVSGEAELQLP